MRFTQRDATLFAARDSDVQERTLEKQEEAITLELLTLQVVLTQFSLSVQHSA